MLTSKKKIQKKDYHYLFCVDVILDSNGFLFLSYWIKKFPIHFDADKRLKEACEKLQNLIELTGDSDCKDLVSLSEL